MRQPWDNRARRFPARAGSLLRRFFSGEQMLALKALQAAPATPEERAEIRRLLDIAETPQPRPAASP
ncbi:MAG: hypothetical protein ABIY70_22095 [Capsulimonas sp.]|uniref:hypothetical protein n=1 Tax=Capsulimonas sp. TaxID=2494211 RepID=UPI00326460BD